MVFRHISERVCADTETVGSGNAGAILLDDRTVVIDAQFAPLARQLRSNIEKVCKRRITHLLLTHSHSDHVFGNEVFQDCEIIAHKNLKARMEELTKSSWSRDSLQKQVAELRKTDPQRAARLENVHIVLPTKTFDKEFLLGEGELKIEMTYTGGHTGDSSIVYFPHGRTLFAGDLIFSRIYPYGGDPTADPDLWIEALNNMKKMNPDMIVPGHGPLCGLDEVDRYTKYISDTKSVMLELIAQGKPEDRAIIDPSLPKFYEEGAQNRRANTLAHWYRLWKQRTPR